MLGLGQRNCGSRCNTFLSDDHDFQIVKATWQVPNLMSGRTQNLEHSKERMVCKRCGKIVDAFPEFTVGMQGG